MRAIILIEYYCCSSDGHINLWRRHKTVCLNICIQTRSYAVPSRMSGKRIELATYRGFLATCGNKRIPFDNGKQFNANVDCGKYCFRIVAMIFKEKREARIAIPDPSYYYDRDHNKIFPPTKHVWVYLLAIL